MTWKDVFFKMRNLEHVVGMSLSRYPWMRALLPPCKPWDQPGSRPATGSPAREAPTAPGRH